MGASVTSGVEEFNHSASTSVCSACKSFEEGDFLLVCDACEAGYHLYCLSPPILHIPRGNWFCPHCTQTTNGTRNTGALGHSVKSTRKIRCKPRGTRSPKEGLGEHQGP